MTENIGHAKSIPKVVFLENIDAWVEKYGGQELINEMNQLYQKYKYMEQGQLRSRVTLKIKLPDIKKTLEIVKMMKKKHESDEQEFQTNFLVSDTIWAKAKIPNKDAKVGLWLGANVMVEYPFDDAIAILEKNLNNANNRLEQTQEELNFIKDNITTLEVNIARVYNQTVKNS